MSESAPPAGMAGIREDCEMMIDQSRSVDNQRRVRSLGTAPAVILREVKKKRCAGPASSSSGPRRAQGSA